jgi:hypothetical protein
MLSKSAKDSLTVYAEERHPYQNQAVAMVGETLAGLQAKFEDDIAQSQAKVDAADKEKASRIEAETTAKATLEKLEETLKSAKATVDADTAAEKTAKNVLSAAEDAVASKDAEKTGLEDMKSRLTTCKDTYETLKTKKVDSKRTVTALAKCLSDAGLEDGLADSLDDTFKKEPAARSTYDGVVFKEVDLFMIQKFAELEASLAGWEPGKTDLVTKQGAAEAAHVASLEKLKASHTALAEAEIAKKDGKKAYATAHTAVASYDSDMSKVAKALTKANFALEAFSNGPKKCFETLKDLAPPPPEPEPVVEEAPTTEATAEANID